MCMKVGALASFRHLHSSSRFGQANCGSGFHTISRQLSSFSSIWKVYKWSASPKKSLDKKPPLQSGKSSKSSPLKLRRGRGFSDIFLAQAMSSETGFNAPIDRQRFHVQFITTPTADTPGTTLLLHFNSKRYLFGRVAEGTQRACAERGVSLKKARNIFLTGETKWAHNSGLLGMILTMADFQTEANEEEQKVMGQIRIHGGPKIWHSIACARRFIFRTGMPLRVFEAKPDSWQPSQEPDFIDENVVLWALPVQRKGRRGSSPPIPDSRRVDSMTIDQEQSLRQKTVLNMFDSDWRKDKLSETVFEEVHLPAMVWVRDPESKSLQATFCTKMADAPHIRPDQKVLVRMPWPAALVAELPPADNLLSSVSMCYIVKGRPQRGTFIAEKAKSLGVKPGPSYGLLAAGQSVTAEDGRVITSDQVMGPILPSQGIAILDIPDVCYLPDLQQKLTSMQAGQLSHLHAFVWILGDGVAESQDFLNFKSSFPDVMHVGSCVENSGNYLAMASSAASATRLNQIRPEIFPVPLHNNEVPETANSNGDLLRAQRGLILDLAPKFEVNAKEVPSYLDVQATINAMSAETRALIPSGSENHQSTEKYQDVSVVTLGTGSAMPSKYRNVSANLLHIPSLGYFLFDAGENTLGQLRRLYSPEQLDDILCNLHMIWISHLHADHHLGTVSIMTARRDAVRKRREAGFEIAHNLYLVSERNMADYLEDYKSVEINDAVMIHCLNSELADVNSNPIKIEDTTMPISKFSSARVSHCHGAQAVSVTFSNGFKLSYSGDCRPSATFAEIGRDSDILIHEATFDDGMEGDAFAKRHCTIGEALGVAHAMKAKNVILTHFSQRYQKLPTLKDVRLPGQLKFEEVDDANDIPETLQEGVVGTVDDSASGSQANLLVPNSAPLSNSRRHTSLQEVAQQMSICVAFDLMRVTIPQIKDMYRYYPAIEHMFEIEQQKADSKREVQRLANEAVVQARDQKALAKRKAGEMKNGGKANSRKDKRNGTSVSGTHTPSPQRWQQQHLIEE